MKRLASKLSIVGLLILTALLYPNPALAGILVDCPSGGQGIQTAIGCVPTQGSTDAFMVFMIQWGLGIGGGVAFLLIIYSGFMIITSEGNPQRLSAGKELLTAAVSGLVLLIFSAFILRIVGRDILGLL